MSDTTKGLRLYNTLTRSKEEFAPIDPANVRMYVCGPTVYDYAHIGNARPAIVFDVLFRLLRHLYGAEHVTYVRNITDVDDKINARALRDFGAEIDAGRLSLNEAIRKVTEPTYEQYQKDVTALGCLAPTHQPRATEFVLPRADGRADMVTLIQSLITRGHAYAANGEILFDTASMGDYGKLSRRPLDEQIAGARIAVESHKKNPQDFVLWKESSAEEPGWPASFTVEGRALAIRGRPGWHIECSAMSSAYLGEVFDIHGGGLDLIFPHHENEIAQSRCAHGTDVMANTWMHNGFLQVEGRKMSKSDGNFVTIHELLETEKFGGRAWHGGVLRLAMLKTHYRQPIDWTFDSLTQARRDLFSFSVACGSPLTVPQYVELKRRGELPPVDAGIVDALSDDLNTSLAVSRLHALANMARANRDASIDLLHGLDFLGLVQPEQVPLYGDGYVADIAIRSRLDRVDIASLTERIRVAIANGDEQARSRSVQEIEDVGVDVDLTGLERVGSISITSRNSDEAAIVTQNVASAVESRLAFIAAKNWAEADRIRDELLAQGIQLKDGKDPATGERITTWEVKR